MKNPTKLELSELHSEHKHILLVCQHIRIGLRKAVAPERIRKYTDWISEKVLEPHFEQEERNVFSLLGPNVRVKKALANHRRIRKLLSCSCSDERVLNLLEEELARYVRFEERILQKELDCERRLLKTEAVDIARQKMEVWEDHFWE